MSTNHSQPPVHQSSPFYENGKKMAYCGQEDNTPPLPGSPRVTCPDCLYLLTGRPRVVSDPPKTTDYDVLVKMLERVGIVPLCAAPNDQIILLDTRLQTQGLSVLPTIIRFDSTGTLQAITSWNHG